MENKSQLLTIPPNIDSVSDTESIDMAPKKPNSSPWTPDNDLLLAGTGKAEREQQSSSKYSHRPVFLHPFVGWALISLLILLCFFLFAISAYSHKNNGLFTISPNHDNRSVALRLLWSSGPTLMMTIITSGILCPIVFALYLIAPYAELEKGGARAEHSIMANYAIHSMHERLEISVRNRKWGLAALAVAGLLSNLVDTAAYGLIESQTIIVRSFLRDYYYAQVY